MPESSSSFLGLDPNSVLLSIEDAGFHPTGELTQLNSYENRVFEVVLEGSERKKIVAKFYRPGRWSKAAILEEHGFLNELAQQEVPVVAPLSLPDNSSLYPSNDMYMALFPKKLGRMPEEFLEDDLYRVGRRLAEIHNLGSQKKFEHRPKLILEPGLADFLQWLEPHLVPELRKRYLSAAEVLHEGLSEEINTSEYIRIHGDCHRGNLLDDGKEFFFVDFDDCCMGPAIQDFWMLLSGLDEQDEKEKLIAGYEEFREFPDHQWDWIPLLRGFRMVYYSSWIAKRWRDPSFPRLFPEFGSYNYWAEETEALESCLR